MKTSQQVVIEFNISDIKALIQTEANQQSELQNVDDSSFKIEIKTTAKQSALSNLIAVATYTKDQ